MRTTIDLPDELFRRAKSEAALRSGKFKDLVEEGLLRVLESPDESSRTKRKITVYDLMKDATGIAASGVGDLATNPKHMESFGRD